MGAVVLAGAVAVAVVAGTGGTGGTGGSGGSQASRPSGTGPASSGSAAPGNPDDARVAANAAARDAVLPLLAARAGALRRGDLAGWLAMVDPRQPRLVRAETVLFRNLRQLPLARFAWTADPAALPEGYRVPDDVRSRIVGASEVASPGMTLTYQLRGFDRVPVADPYVPVVFSRGGHWYLGGDQTSQTELGSGRVEPWTLGPVRVAVTRRVLVVVSSSDAGRLRSLAATADASVASVASMWPSGWSRTAVLYATRDREVFATFLGHDRDVDDADGLTVGAGPDDHSRPNEDTRVVVNPKYVHPGSRQMPVLLRHEFTHVALWNGVQDGAPTWAVEGVAEYTAYRRNPTAQRVTAAIGTDATAGRLAATLPASDTFYGGPDQAYHYGVAWLAWEYVGETYGNARVRALYGRLAAIGAPRDSTAALAAENRAFAAVLHLSERTYVRRLDAWIAKVLSPA